MESPLKRRRVSIDRSISMSPVKITISNGISNSSYNDTELPADFAANFPSSTAPARLSLSRSSVAELREIARRSLGMDGQEDDIFDMRNIGKERKSTPQRLAPTPLRSTTPSQLGDRSVSPARSAGSGRGSGDGPSQSSNVSKGKRVSFANEDDLAQKVFPSELPAAHELPDPAPPSTQVTESEPLNETPAAAEESMFEEMDTVPDGTEEPDLPQLPLEEGPQQARGLLSSSPSGRAFKRRESRKPAGRSPSPPRPTTDEPGTRFSDEMEFELTQPEDETMQEESFAEVMVSVKRRGPIQPFDAESDRLQDELIALKQQRDLLRKGNELLEKVLLEKTSSSLDQATREETFTILENDDSLLGRKPESVSVFDKLARFLPFAKRPLGSPIAAGPPKTHTEDPKAQLLSNELRELFMPLELEHSISAKTYNADSAKMICKCYSVKFRSPDDALRVGFKILVKMESNLIERIDPISNYSSSWAARELGSFLEQFYGERGRRDVASIGLACKCYLDMALRRAKIWIECIKDHSGLVTDVPSSHQKPGSKGKSVDRSSSALSSHYDRQSLYLRKGPVSLLILWKIGFEWTGEVRSHVTASAAFPESWRELDKAKVLYNVGELFDLLVRRHGVRRAISMMVQVLFDADS